MATTVMTRGPKCSLELCRPDLLLLMFSRRRIRDLYFDFSDELADGLVIGASVAINGTCLTAWKLFRPALGVVLVVALVPV